MTPPGGGGGGRRVLGVDSGGSGLRIALAEVRAGGPPVPLGSRTSSEPVRTGPRGIDPGHLLARLLPAARALLAEAGEAPDAGTEPPGAADAGAGGLAAVCVGAAGMASLGEGLRASLPGALAGELGVRRVALAADAVTAYAGALGARPGAVVAGGTGLIAMGTDLRTWRRADGWGHLLGDCGGGAWIGRAGLDAAMRAYDGREGGSAALRERAEAFFGVQPGGLPALLYPRQDRAAVLASFAPEVAGCAEEDPVAGAVLRSAAREIAASAAAVVPGAPPGPGVPGGSAEGDGAGGADGPGAGGGSGDGGGSGGPQGQDGAGGGPVSFTGGLFRIGAPLLVPLAEELELRLPGVRTVEAAGGPLEGALLLAAGLADAAPSLPEDPALLWVR